MQSSVPTEFSRALDKVRAVMAAKEIREWMGHKVSSIMGFDADLFDQAAALGDLRSIQKLFTDFLGDTAEVRRFAEEAATRLRTLAKSSEPPPARPTAAAPAPISAPAVAPRLVSHSGGAKVSAGAAGRKGGGSRSDDGGVLKVTLPATSAGGKQAAGKQTPRVATPAAVVSTAVAPVAATPAPAPAPGPGRPVLQAAAAAFVPSALPALPLSQPSAPPPPQQPVCGCFATRHGLYVNCTACGRIQCEAEAAPACSECGAMLRVSGMGVALTPETATAARARAVREDEARAAAPLQALLGGAAGAAAPPLPAPAPAEKGGGASAGGRAVDEALRHRDQLLEFQRTVRATWAGGRGSAGTTVHFTCHAPIPCSLLSERGSSMTLATTLPMLRRRGSARRSGQSKLPPLLSARGRLHTGRGRCS